MKELALVFDDRPVRMVVVRGEPWFVGKDVAEVLGYKDTVNAIKQHCNGVAKHHPMLDSMGRSQEVRIIAEPDLYRLIIGSHLPTAERFERWVFEDVLPSIRKTGRYAVSAEALRESAAARSALCRQWQAHGADKFYHYVNLTRSEYEALFGDRSKKKEAMTEAERAKLMVFESLEYYKLVLRDDVSGYHQLDDSLKTTARQLPLFTVHAIGERVQA